MTDTYLSRFHRIDPKKDRVPLPGSCFITNNGNEEFFIDTGGNERFFGAVLIGKNALYEMAKLGGCLTPADVLELQTQNKELKELVDAYRQLVDSWRGKLKQLIPELLDVPKNAAEFDGGII